MYDYLLQYSTEAEALEAYPKPDTDEYIPSWIYESFSVMPIQVILGMVPKTGPEGDYTENVYAPGYWIALSSLEFIDNTMLPIQWRLTAYRPTDQVVQTSLKEDTIHAIKGVTPLPAGAKYAFGQAQS